MFSTKSVRIMGTDVTHGDGVCCRPRCCPGVELSRDFYVDWRDFRREPFDGAVKRPQRSDR